MTIILVFEPATILQHREKDWSRYNRLGDCYLPQVVLKELEFLTDRAILPEEEKIAREFMRFWSNSHWRIHRGLSSHPAFSRAQGASLSKKARLQDSIVESVYDLCIQNPQKLIILVTNHQNLRANLARIQTKNSIGITLAQFNLWLRTQQQPNIVTKTIAQLSNFTTNQTIETVDSSNDKPKAKVKQKLTPTTQKVSANQRIKKTSLTRVNPISSFINGILALATLCVIGILIWYLTEPESFRRFIEQNQLSYLKTL